MAHIALILQLAITLLVSAQAPNVPLERRLEAEKYARNAIEIATKAIATYKEPIKEAVQTYTPIIQPVTQPAPILGNEEPQADEKITLTLLQCEGMDMVCTVKAEFYRNGNKIYNIPITMNSSKSARGARINGKDGGIPVTVYTETEGAIFNYRVLDSTPSVLTATYEKTSASINIRGGQ